MTTTDRQFLHGHLGKGFQTTRPLTQQQRDRLQFRGDGYEVTAWLFRDPVEAEVPRCQTQQRNGQQCERAGVARRGISWTVLYDADGFATCSQHGGR